MTARQSVITCPRCEARTEAEMPLDVCQFFWECPTCETVVRPKKGDCCVFCSYGDAPCPSARDHDRDDPQ